MRAAVASKRLGISLGLLGLCLVAAGAIGSGLARAGSNERDRDKDKAKSDSIAAGYEIFNREWMPNDPRGHGGDGLGPAFNDSSCIACHNSGGSGGAGPVSKNIDILSASRNQGFMGNQPSRPAAPAPGRPGRRVRPAAAGRRAGRGLPAALGRSARAAVRPPRRVQERADRRPPQVRHRPRLRGLPLEAPRRRDDPVPNPNGQFVTFTTDVAVGRATWWWGTTSRCRRWGSAMGSSSSSTGRTPIGQARWTPGRLPRWPG